MSTHIHVRDISHAIHGVCTLWFTYDSMLLLCAQFTVGIPHPTNHMPPNFREFFYIGDENISPAPTLPKAGRSSCPVKKSPAVYISKIKNVWRRRHLVSWESCHNVVANPSEPSTAASESERKRVLILLIYTAGRALGEQLPTTLPPTSPYFSQSYDSASQMVSVRTIR